MYSLIQSSRTIGIFTHINPDGDALGSSFAMAAYLESLGKRVTVFLPTAISESLEFMTPAECLFGISVFDEDSSSAIKEEISRCDLLIGLDFNTLSRIGGLADPFGASAAKKLLIDHHVGPQTEAFDMVRSRTDVSSASELLYQLLLEMPGIEGDPSRLPEASRRALMTGMTTDTNNFANSVFPSTLVMASQLLASGVDRDSIIDNLYFRYPERCIRLRGHALESLMKINRRGVGYIILDDGTMKAFDVHEGDTEGLVNIPLSIDSVRMSILVKEEVDSRRIRISIRSKKGTSARECAMRYFHGGGHELASGGRLMKGEDVEKVEDVEKLIEKMSEEFFVE